MLNYGRRTALLEQALLRGRGRQGPHAKIRRTVQEHVQHENDRMVNMTTVVCLHTAIIQKAYSSEKCFLCPPRRSSTQRALWQRMRPEAHHVHRVRDWRKIAGGRRLTRPKYDSELQLPPRHGHDQGKKL
ncbi:hypothetical protein DFH11DRAFT_1617981 [Phellopilus nigrolimitatus]|nr:hypothetical protein DFH11DRAFT_1617981 [Phellopilus nigrolimitatus]